MTSLRRCQLNQGWSSLDKGRVGGGEVAGDGKGGRMVQTGRVCAKMEQMFICVCFIINSFIPGINDCHIKTLK